MGIVRVTGREMVRLSTETREREGRPTSNDARGVGKPPVLGSVASGDLVAEQDPR
jgi:hypothetical protein